jgi:SAM-dependent methyltransferase
MFRFILIAFFFIFISSCNEQNKNESSTEESDQEDIIQESDELPTSMSEFDALIKKYEDPERVNWQNPDMVLKKMGDIKGKTIADIGIGTGYFAFRIVKNGGNVIGIDIEQRFLDYIEERKSDLPQDLSNNIVTRLTKPDDPNLNPQEVDWVLIVNTYYILDNRVMYLKKIREGLKSGGKILVVDFKKGDIPVGPTDDEKVPLNQALEELKAAGFRIIDSDMESLQYQYIIVAQK